MKNFLNKLEDGLTKVADGFSRNFFLNVISGAFTMIMPFTIVGSIASLIKGIDFGGYQAFIQSTPVYYLLGDIYAFTVGLLAIYIVFSIGYQYAMKRGMRKQAITIGLSSLIAFFLITPYTRAESLWGASGLSTQWFGATGLFMAMVVGFVVGFVYELCFKNNIEIKLPSQVPPTIARQFSALIPAFIVIILFVAVNWVFTLTPLENAQAALYSVVRIPLSIASASILGQMFLLMFGMLMWFFGIHGGLVVMPMIMTIFTTLRMENLAAFQAGLPLPNMITGNTLSIGNGSLPLVIALLIFAKAKQNRSITNVAAVPSLFGVDEPAYFGVPMIMNPIFFIPWVLITPAFLNIGTFILQSIGLLGYHTGATAGDFMPFFVTNLVGYGVPGLIWGCVFMVIAVLYYLPFIMVYDKQCLDKEGKTEEAVETED